MADIRVRTAARLGQAGAFFGMGMLEVAKKHPELCVLSADLIGTCGLSRFVKMHPEKFVNTGIAEQNMVSIAAGMAMEGNLVYATSYASFAVVRAMEQIRQNMSNLHTNVKLVGFDAGYTVDFLGKTHWATEDITFMRSMPGMVVLSPADAFEAIKVCEAAAEFDGPAYIRLSGLLNSPIVYQDDYEFKIGKAILLKEGKDTVLIATGRMVHEALQAAQLLDERGVDAAVVNMHTIKPIDTKMLQELCAKYEHVFTVEEHSVIGGLGGAVAEYISGTPKSAQLTRIGMQDEWYEFGSKDYLWEQAGINREKIANAVENKLQNGGN